MLDNLNKSKNPFKVPENYFQNFNAEMMDKLPAKENVAVKKVPLWKMVIPWTAVAAAFIGVLFLTGVFNRNTTSDPTIVIAETDNTNDPSIVLSEEEDIFYAFLEDEVLKAQYKEMMYN
ncbi:hypothetical protein GGR21_002138 [Dysgonomonas hofstadii]|uniref:Uncharacterized protein n=1 Tax=Dysgonomonas hofstadii TaxID=637886 RepID=A0A840CJL6_9BACT|nr:hypothetical protein [Dysgonomonas hofstadii]MBB4036237.1 hypothetical protein [Dysgonomonas hofstadii]